MISLHENRDAQRDARLSMKTQDQALMRLAMVGAGLTRWEAQELPRAVASIYFKDHKTRPWKDGEMRYQCVDTQTAFCRQHRVSVPTLRRWLQRAPTLPAESSTVTFSQLVIPPRHEPILVTIGGACVSLPIAPDVEHLRSLFTALHDAQVRPC